MRTLFLFLSCFVLVACTPLPELPQRSSPEVEDEIYPDFVPLENVQLDQTEIVEQNDETEAALEARVARLRSRAAQLRNTPAQ